MGAGQLQAGCIRRETLVAFLRRLYQSRLDAVNQRKADHTPDGVLCFTMSGKMGWNVTVYSAAQLHKFTGSTTLRSQCLISTNTRLPILITDMPEIILSDGIVFNRYH